MWSTPGLSSWALVIFNLHLVDEVKYSEVNLFADDTCVYLSYNNRLDGISKINEDLNNIIQWSKRWLMDFNPAKTVNMFISNKRSNVPHPDIVMEGNIINEVKSHKHLGVILNHDLSWCTYIDDVCLRSKRRLDIMKFLKYKITRKHLEMCYNSFIRPILESGDVLFAGSSLKDFKKLHYIEKEAMRIVSGS